MWLTDVGGSATVCPTGLSDWSDRPVGRSLGRTDPSVRRSERVNAQLGFLRQGGGRQWTVRCAAVGTITSTSHQCKHKGLQWRTVRSRSCCTQTHRTFSLFCADSISFLSVCDYLTSLFEWWLYNAVWPKNLVEYNLSFHHDDLHLVI